MASITVKVYDNGAMKIDAEDANIKGGAEIDINNNVTKDPNSDKEFTINSGLEPTNLDPKIKKILRTGVWFTTNPFCFWHGGKRY